VRHRRKLFPPWEPVWDGQGGRIARNDGALPLFQLPARIRPVAGPEEALAATLANQDFAAAAVVEEEPEPGARPARPGPRGSVPGAPASAGAGAVSLPPGAPEPGAPASAGGTGQHGRVEITRARPNGFDLRAESPTGGVVVSSVSWARGWKLRQDGAARPVLRANAGFVGFRVPPGQHRVALDYRPDSWTWGLRLGALGLAGALAAAAGGALTRRAALRSGGARAPARWRRDRRSP
jgi:hypothetical protein